MGKETELKLTLPLSALPALQDHPLWRKAEPVGDPRLLENTYYDTPTLDLWQRRIGLRIRSDGQSRLQTVKCASTSSGGISVRPEWEEPFLDAFHFDAIDDPHTRRYLQKHREELVPVFTTCFQRETRRYQPDEQTTILLMIDTGEITCGENSEPLCELELELANGDAQALLQLARQLADPVPLLPSDFSKAERGYRLFLHEPVTPARIEVPDVRTDQTPVEAFRVLAGNGLRQWQVSLHGAMNSRDPEFIHQLRVSQRRLRSLLRLFAPVLPAQFVVEWNEYFRGNAARLGDARDFEVLMGDILEPVQGTSDDEIAALIALKDVIGQARRSAEDQGFEALDPGMQGRLMLDFSLALHQLSSPAATHRLKAFARARLEAARKKVRKRHQQALSLQAQDLHNLRISVKKLRYGIDFLSPLFPKKELSRYLKALRRTQNTLGYIHDVDVARHVLATQAGDDPMLQRATAYVCGWHGFARSKRSRRVLDDLQSLLDKRAPWQR